MSEPAVVAVMGSCLTRDNFNRQFNPDYKNWFAIGPCTNQSSMIALTSPPVDAVWEPLEPMKDYGLWNVASDLSREILGLLADEQPAYVVLDFFGDVHFGALRTADGQVVTNNRWKLHKTDLYRRLMDLPGTTVISWQEDREEFLRQWRDAVERFAEFIADNCPTSTVVVHRGFNVQYQLGEDGVQLTPMGPKEGMKRGRWVRRSNRLWREIDDHAVTAHGWESIDLGPEWWTTYTEHPWGPFDVHYTPDYYRRFLAELHAIDVKRALPEADARAVDEARFAARRRVRSEVRFWRKLRDELAERNAEAPRRFRWKRPPRPDLTRPEAGSGADRDILAALAPRLSVEQQQRLSILPESADAHIAFLRTVWRPRIERLLGQ